MSTTAGVLRLLLGATAAVSGQAMAQELGCTRQAVAKAVDSLRRKGFEIEAAAGSGYRLVAEPRGLVAERVQARVGPGAFGWQMLVLDESPSTNLEARRLAEEGASHGLVVAAEHQSAGRGRLGRRWKAPRGSCLLFSVLLRPKIALDEIFVLNNVFSLACCLALEERGLEPAIKWPNDVFLEGGKLAGILTEFTSRAEQVEYAVVGVGLNVNVAPEQLKALGPLATSLMALTARAWDRAELLAGILTQATRLYAQLEVGQGEQLRREYEKRCMLLGRHVEVADINGQVRGVARGIDPDGALVLETPEGLKRVRHGDATVLSL